MNYIYESWNGNTVYVIIVGSDVNPSVNISLGLIIVPDLNALSANDTNSSITGMNMSDGNSSSTKIGMYSIFSSETSPQYSIYVIVVVVGFGSLIFVIIDCCKKKKIKNQDIEILENN